MALDASQCPGGCVDFIATYRSSDATGLMSLPGKQPRGVRPAGGIICGDEPSWAKAYDDSYGSKPAEHLSLISVGRAPNGEALVLSPTRSPIRRMGDGAAFARRFTASMAQRR